MSSCYVLLASTNVSLVCAVDKHRCLLAMCCQQAPMSPCYVLSASTNVSLLCAVSKHQHIPAMCCWQAPMSPWYVLLTSTDVFLLCAVGKHQCLLGMCCRQAPCLLDVLSASTNVSLLCTVSKHQCLLAMWYPSTNISLLCAVGKHQCLLGMCCRQAPMSSCYVLLASTNVSLLCAVVNYQNLLASCGCRQAQRKQPSRDQEGSDGGTCCNVVYLKNLLAPFLHAYDFFMQTVKNIKQTWHTSVSGSVFEFVLLFKGQTTIILPAVL